jgi:hypothetical protein
MRWRLVLLPVLLTACGGTAAANLYGSTTTKHTYPTTTKHTYPTSTTKYPTSTTVAPTTTPEVTSTTVVTTNTFVEGTTTTGAPTSTTTTTTPTQTTSGPSTSTSPSTTTLPPTSTSAAPTTTTSSPPSTTTTTTSPTTTSSAPTTSSVPPSTSSPITTTTLPPTFQFAGATTVCIVEVPTIQIIFANALPQLAGHTGTLTMTALNGTPVSTQSLVYQPNTTVNLLYPGTRVNADGSIADVPGWNLNSDGFWVRDPSDAFLRDGIVLTYTVNPTATATVTYPPESSACANPNGPFPPGSTTMPDELPPTGNSSSDAFVVALLTLVAGSSIVLTARRRRV